MAAARYQQLAADLGSAPGMFELASFYESGIGVEPDIAQAASWYLESARRGYPPSQHNVATMFEEGAGVPREPVTDGRQIGPVAGFGVSLFAEVAKGAHNDRKIFGWKAPG